MTKRHSAAIKPLQLLDSATQDIVKTPSASTSSPRESRRQSSISYVSSPTSTLSRHTSLGPASFPKQKENNRRSTGSLPPVTLVEKHADLLHFIAQKESKCLELRSQLAVHEAELLQLKRKWERIVSRGLEKERAETEYAVTSPVLDGIKEGVQGVGKLLAYGLSPSTPPSPKKRSYQSSTSSISTTSSTDVVTPVSDDEDETPPPKEILMVSDTGASPVVSPNPEFIHQKREREKRMSKEYSVPVLDPITGPGAKDTLRARRSLKSRPPLESSQSSSPAPSPSPTPASPNVLSPLDYSEFNPTSMAARSASSKKSNNRLSLPPISSMPGLALSTVVSPESVSSWVGKKWEDTMSGLTNSSKSSKRASVSSMLQALTSPPPKAKTSPPPRKQTFDEEVRTPRSSAIQTGRGEDSEWNW